MTPRELRAEFDRAIAIFERIGNENMRLTRQAAEVVATRDRAQARNRRLKHANQLYRRLIRSLLPRRSQAYAGEFLDALQTALSSSSSNPEAHP